MIDFIKIYYSDKKSFEAYILEEGNFKDVYQQVETHTGDILYPLRTKFENMDYVVSEKSGYIKNSLHKFYNHILYDEDQNFNDFTYSSLCHSIDHLSSKMTDIRNTGITQLEVGLNINTPIPAEKIIRKNILMHNYSGFNHNKKYYGQGELKQFDHSTYFIKIYDKAKQYRREFNLTENILRFELKIIKARDFQELGIFNLYDLKDKSKLRRLFKLLIDRFDELTITDDISNYEQFNGNDGQNLLKYQNPRFWEDLSENNKRQTKSRYKKDFERILNEYNLLKTKQSLRALLVKKFINLMNN